MMNSVTVRRFSCSRWTRNSNLPFRLQVIAGCVPCSVHMANPAVGPTENELNIAYIQARSVRDGWQIALEAPFVVVVLLNLCLIPLLTERSSCQVCLADESKQSTWRYIQTRRHSERHSLGQKTKHAYDCGRALRALDSQGKLSFT